MFVWKNRHRSWKFTFIVGILLSVLIDGRDAKDFSLSPLQKLKKIVRITIDIKDLMVVTEINDADAVAAVPVVEGAENGRSVKQRSQKLRRNGKTMITSAIADRWMRKTINVVKWIQRKYVGGICAKYGNPVTDDAEEVFGKKFFDNYDSHQFQKYIALLILDGSKTMRSVAKPREDYPLTALYLNYAKMRLWISENLSVCHDKEKVDALLSEGSKAAGAKRILNWDNTAEKKFLRLETRLCTNINKKLLVRTRPGDNPYFDNPHCNSDLFRVKRREKMNAEKKKERDEKRKNDAARKQKAKEERKKKKAAKKG